MTEKELLQLLLDKVTGIEVKINTFEQRFDRLEQRLDKVEQRLDGLEQRLGKVEQRLDGLEQRLGKVEQRLDRIEHSINAVNEQVVKNSEDISQTATKKDVALIHQRLDFQLSKIAKTEESIDILKQEQNIA